MAAAAKDAEIAGEFVSVPLVCEVMDVEVLRGTAVHAASTGTLERGPASRFPLRAAEVGAVLCSPRGSLLFFHHGDHEERGPEGPDPPRQVYRDCLSVQHAPQIFGGCAPVVNVDATRVAGALDG